MDIEYGLQAQSLQEALLCDLGEKFNEHTKHVLERPLFYFQATYLLCQFQVAYTDGRTEIELRLGSASLVDKV